MRKHRLSGFTLIELSIVLVIIGLIVGGVLVGRDLISAAAVRSQISQIEKLNSAVNTFKDKFNNYLPGDIPEPDASRFGFQPRGQNAGQGDGNGILEGNPSNTAGQNSGIRQGAGETPLFWADLSQTKLVEGNFNTGGLNYPNATIPPCYGGCAISGTALDKWVPQGKIGNGNYLYVYSMNSFNYFGLSAIATIGYTISSKTALTVSQAYNMDKKVDDGVPQTGTITAQYINYDIVNYAVIWAAGNNAQGAYTGSAPVYGSSTAATAGSSATCYDNNNIAGATQQYSVTQNNGAGVNCALSFKFQ